MAWHRRRSNRTVDELAQVPALARCGRRDRAELAGHVDRLRLADGTVVARAGATARQVVVVLEGALQVGTTGLAGPGALVDAVAVVDEGSSPADVIAVGEADVEMRRIAPTHPPGRDRCCVSVSPPQYTGRASCPPRGGRRRA